MKSLLVFAAVAAVLGFCSGRPQERDATYVHQPSSFKSGTKWVLFGDGKPSASLIAHPQLPQLPQLPVPAPINPFADELQGYDYPSPQPSYNYQDPVYSPNRGYLPISR